MEVCRKHFKFEFLNDLVTDFIEDNSKFSITSYDVCLCGRDVVGYQGEYCKLKVNYKQYGEIKELYFFVKSLPKDEIRAKKLIEVGYFQREFGVYSKILAEFDKIQENPNYHARSALSSTFEIILEDLHEKGYTVRRPRIAFDKDHSLVALKSLARFHAGSIIYEEHELAKTGQKVKIEEKYRDILKECGYVYNGWYIAGQEASLAISTKNKKLFKLMIQFSSIKRLRDVFKLALDLCRPSTTQRNVLCHRDLWANNLMFKYDQTSTPINCVFVDFQASICMPPAGDVVSLIYLNLEKQNRDLFYDELISCYYDNLKIELSKHSIAIEDAYMNFDDYKEHCELYKLWGLVQALILHQFALLRPEDEADLLKDEFFDRICNVNRNSFVTNTMHKDTVYKQRMMENLEELIETYVGDLCY